ncbi:MAG: sugar phosphate isomerase/epimerase family protein, partial [Planctomycetota bacterium]
YRAGVAADARRITEAAHSSGIRIATEWHGNTLTDTPESAQAFFEAVDRPELGTYWQPRSRGRGDDCLRELDVVLPRLAGLHVFYWDSESGRKLPLEEGAALWRPCLSRAAQAGDMFALLEFVIDGDPQQMLRDAAALRAWLGEMAEA